MKIWSKPASQKATRVAIFSVTVITLTATEESAQDKAMMGA